MNTIDSESFSQVLLLFDCIYAPIAAPSYGIFRQQSIPIDQIFQPNKRGDEYDANVSGRPHHANCV